MVSTLKTLLVIALVVTPSNSVVTSLVIILRTAHCDVQNVYAPEEDPEMKVEHYERSFEQNEQLGLNDMRTVNYTDENV